MGIVRAGINDCNLHSLARDAGSMRLVYSREGVDRVVGRSCVVGVALRADAERVPRRGPSLGDLRYKAKAVHIVLGGLDTEAGEDI